MNKQASKQDLSRWFHSFGGLVVLSPAFHVAFVIPLTSTSSYFSCYTRDFCVVVAVAARIAPAKHGLSPQLVVGIGIVVVVVVILIILIIAPIIFVVVGACFVTVCARSIVNVDPTTQPNTI